MCVIKYFTMLLVICGLYSVTIQAQDRPNVVIIFMDDMGYGDLESYGAFGYQTPHTNKMAAEGMRFTNFYAAQAVCSASRAALLTGCYPNRVGISGALSAFSTIALNPQEETIAEMLKRNGYQTGMFGKWHLGDHEPYLPLQHGFDEYLGLPYSNDMWRIDYDGTPVTDKSHRKFRHPPLPLIEGNKRAKVVASLEDQAELTTLYTKKACDFIQRKKDNPFFLYLAHSMPHVPIAVSDKFRGKSKAGLYGDVMIELDWSVGEVLRTLEKLKLSEKTLVIVTSDNGPWRNFGNHAGNTGGLREGKGTSFEGGVRIPCLMQWKGKIPSGSICNKISSTIDLLPTIAAITNSKLPSSKIDGVDITSLLINEAGAEPRDHFVYYYRKDCLEAVRKGRFKLVFPHPHRTYYKEVPGYDGWPGEAPNDTTALALYDLAKDPGESVDVREKFPDVAKELNELADRYRSELGDALTDRKGSAVRPAAQVSR
jgi:arylsulfatase A-like enzyme